MKNILLSIGLCLTGIALTGCIVVGVDHNSSAPPAVVVPSTTADSVAFAEIDAASKLDFENARVSALIPVAGRTNLTATSQVYLVNTTMRRLDFDNDKITVLKTLISNQAFCNPAKQTILTSLGKLNFDNDRAGLLALLNERGELKD